MFTDLIKRKAKELGIEFGECARESEVKEKLMPGEVSADPILRYSSRR